MGFVGLDVLAIRHLARQLDTQSNEVTSAAKELDAAVVSTAWHGADREAFLRDWESTHRPALLRAAELLREAAAIAQQGAVDQDRVSRS